MNEKGQLCGSYFDGHGPFLKIQIVIIVPNNSKLGLNMLYHEKS